VVNSNAESEVINNVAGSPKILIAISSSGDSPFLEIEQMAQSVTFGKTDNPNVKIIWVEGDPNLARKFRFRALNWLVGLIHKNIYGPNFQVSATRGRVRFRVNLKPLLDKLYDPQHSRNGFSRALSKIVGDPRPVTVSSNGRRVRLGLPNSYFLVPIRDVEKFRYLASLQFDYVLSTTSTCYVDVSKLVTVVSQLPRRGVYAGPKMKLGCPFVPGNHTLMSRDVAQTIVELSDFMRFDVPNDVGIGQLVQDFGVANLMDIHTENVEASFVRLNELSPNWRSTYLFRCRAEAKTLNSGPVIQSMLRLHQLLGSNQIRA